MDYFTNTEADAGRYEAAHYDGYDDRFDGYEPEPEETERRQAAPRTLVDDVSSAVVWSGATGSWRKDIRETAKGVCAFRLADDDNADRLIEWFGYEALQGAVVMHGDQRWMYVRRGPKVSHPDPWADVLAGNRDLDPWAAQDRADRATTAHEGAA